MGAETARPVAEAIGDALGDVERVDERLASLEGRIDRFLAEAEARLDVLSTGEEPSEAAREQAASLGTVVEVLTGLRGALDANPPASRTEPAPRKTRGIGRLVPGEVRDAFRFGRRKRR